MPDYDDSKDNGRSQAPYPSHGSPARNQRHAGNQTMRTSSGMLPPRKTAPPAVVMRKADGTVAPPLPFTGIPADNAAWAFQPHIPMSAPQAPVQARGGDIDGPSVHEAAAAGVSGGGSALPHAERIQAAFGPAHDISHVRAHVGGAAAAASEAIGAQAYATGHQIAFRDAPDVHTAAHEAAHVVQQQRGVQLSGGVGQAGDVYERHADAVADRVVAGESAAELLAAGPTGAAQGQAAAVASGADSSLQRQAALSAAPVQFYKQVKISGKPARASEDDKIVKTGKRELYAAPEHIESGNARLETVGKHGSYIHLAAGADKLSYQGNGLIAVTPTWVDKGSDSGYHKDVNSPNAGGADSEGSKSGDMALWTDCGRSSAAVTGSRGGGDRQVVYTKDGSEVVADGTVDSSVKTYRDGTPNQMANKVYIDLMPAFIKDPKNAAYLTAGVHYTGEDAQKTYKTPADIVEAKTMYDALTKAGRDAFDKQAGINHYANPEIGESYTMATEADMPGFKRMGPKTWNFHWGGVIMKGGTDNVTLENFAVTSEYADSVGVEQGDFIDRDWNFDMYGTVDKSQTFHTEHLDSNTHGNKATTLTARTKGSAMRDWSKASWSSLSDFQRTHWATLGWDESSWDSDTAPSSESKDWSALSADERNAATALGYNETSWNNS
ncbi:MAG: hypothetical protein Tsb0020_42440 [Haliangiales bacterium]